MSTTEEVHTNRLIDATSPYLLQHAHNPVDWYPWGQEALERAKHEKRPIFLSIGYAACHWCHVMERESFENKEIAAVLNKHFVAIKVDREERPDLDDIYMSATMLANGGQGGWPMSVFLTPEQKPFFAGTYFPPTSRYGRPGFKEILLSIAEAWRDRRDDVYRSADNLVEAMDRFATLPQADTTLSADLVPRLAGRLADAFDPRTGGMLSGQTHKFPPSMAMTLMLREYHRTKRAGKPKPVLLERVELTLDHMAWGGIYDQLGGGIARYSTDPEWLVPHFEKMLYDQALVSGVYIEAYLLSGRQYYAEVAKDIFNYVLADLQSPEGAFYSSRDADSEGIEGKYYLWSKDEVLSALGEEAGRLFCSYYDVTETGNWEGHNILNIQRDLETVARINGIRPEALKQSLEASRATLLAVRSKRVPPALDDKILTGWNGLMIASLARGGRITGEPRYVQAAEMAATFILDHMTQNGRLLRTSREHRAHTFGYLDDYAFFVEGLLELYEATFDRRWLAEAARLTDDMIAHFWDERGGAFFFTPDDGETLIIRHKDSQDGALPAGNSLALMNLLRLSLMLGRSDLRDRAEHTIAAFAGKVTEFPQGFERFLQAVAFRDSPPREIAIVGPASDPRTRALIAAVNRAYDPHRVVMLLDPEESGSGAWAETIPLLRGKMLVDRKPAVYVCRNYTCRRPVTEVDQLIAQLQAD